jgi:hypothetical protein
MKSASKKQRSPGDYRLQGIAAALGELADAHYERDLAEMVLKSLGVSIGDLQKAGADAFDLARLKGDAE